jgi:hypothetical protein
LEAARQKGFQRTKMGALWLLFLVYYPAYNRGKVYMRKMGARLLFIPLLFGFTVAGQQSTQLTSVPPRPTCTPIFNTGSCADLWRNYNQALAQRQREELQLYVNRQKELASEAATAPLQQQIDDLKKLSADQQEQLGKLQAQIQADAANLLETKKADAAIAAEGQSTAHRQGMWQGLGIGAGGLVVLILVILGVRRLSRNFTITKKSQSASA